MSILGNIFGAIVGAIARFRHPDKPREWLADWKLPTDLSVGEVSDALDAAAAANPQFKNWRTSIVDLMKLTHTEDPDGSASKENRTALAAELGRPDYTGTATENRWLHAEVFKAIQQRGIPLPDAD